MTPCLLKVCFQSYGSLNLISFTFIVERVHFQCTRSFYPTRGLQQNSSAVFGQRVQKHKHAGKVGRKTDCWTHNKKRGSDFAKCAMSCGSAKKVLYFSDIMYGQKVNQ